MSDEDIKDKTSIIVFDQKSKHSSKIDMSTMLSIAAARAIAAEMNQVCDMLAAKQSGQDLTSTTLLRKAIETVSKDRKDDYGSAAKSFNDIAKLWSVILNREVTAQEVNLCMIALKVARCKNGKFKYDSWLDITGYASLGPSLSCPE